MAVVSFDTEYIIGLCTAQASEPVTLRASVLLLPLLVKVVSAVGWCVLLRNSVGARRRNSNPMSIISSVVVTNDFTDILCETALIFAQYLAGYLYIDKNYWYLFNIFSKTRVSSFQPNP